MSENATEANAKVAERLFIERTLWPKLTRLAQKISQEMLPFWPGEHVAVFEDIRPTDVQARLDEIRTSYPVLSINEIRERYYQLPAVTWGALPVGTEDDQQERTQRAVPLQNEVNDAKTALIELKQWERFTLKRWAKTDSRAFEVRELPDDVAFEVATGLLAAESADEAQVVFKVAREAMLEIG